MKIIDVEQGTIDWLFARAGRLTASQANRVLTPKQMKLSASSQDYAWDLAQERHIEAPLTMEALSEWMLRGTSLEEEAREWYAMHKGCDVAEVGFVQHDTLMAGCSPDGLVGTPDAWEGGVEIKCRSWKEHNKSVIGRREIAPVPQIQFSLWVTGLAWWDVVAYCPGSTGRIHRAYPDPEWMAALDTHVPVFLEGVERALKKIQERPPVVFTSDREEGDDLEKQLQASVDAMYKGAA